MTKVGYKQTEETKKKLSQLKKGKKPKNFGISFGLKGEKNINWKGDEVSYRPLHEWICNNKPKSMFCERCGKITDKLDASSMNHTYERDISKWRWLCRKCHRQEDKNEYKSQRKIKEA